VDEAVDSTAIELAFRARPHDGAVRNDGTLARRQTEIIFPSATYTNGRVPAAARNSSTQGMDSGCLRRTGASWNSIGNARRVCFVAFGAEQRAALLRGRLGLTAQARRELTFDALAAGPAYPGALNSPALDRATRSWRRTGAAEWALAHGGRGALTARTSAAWLGRTPTLEEMFGNRGSVHGNRDVKPERVATRDIGVIGTWRPGSARFAPHTLEGTLSAYRSDATDLLVFVPSGNASSVATNIAAARLSGVELSARAAWAMGLSGDLAWTRAWSEDRGDAVSSRGKVLPGHPAGELHAALTCARTSWRAFAELHATSTLFLDRYNQTRVPARARVDLGCGPQFPRHALDLTLECRNVGDVRGEDFGGYPLPGRSWALNARFHFDRRTETP
jgi:outer membrane receptor protein involved in Fe transport